MLPDLSALFRRTPLENRVPLVPCVPIQEDQALARLPVGHVAEIENKPDRVPRVPQPLARLAMGHVGHDTVQYVQQERVLLKANAGAGFRQMGHTGHEGHVLASEFCDEAMALSAPAAARRQRMLAFLDGHSNIQRAVLTDVNADPGNVILTIGLRGVGTGEIEIPTERYDAGELIAVLDSYAGGVLVDDQVSTERFNERSSA